MESRNLDPARWESLRTLGHRMLDDMLDHLQTRRDGPAWQTIPNEVRRGLDEPVPMDAQGEAETYEDFRRLVLPYPYGNTHPRFWGWVVGTGSPLGMLSELLASGMNPALNGFQQAPELVEVQVLRWLKQLMDFPADASGVLVTGGSMASFIALAAARNDRADFDLNAKGMIHAPRPLVFYRSSETHSCIQKALQLLGVGTDHVRVIGVDEQHRMDVSALVDAVQTDLDAGLKPCCVVANAGTVDQGAFDDFDAVAEVAERFGLWMHVDGAFGASVKLSPRHRHLADGIERADSLAIDFHKWFSAPYGAAAVLIADRAAHQRPFEFSADYFAPLDAGVAAADERFADLGPELSREFRALKVWMCLKAHGVKKYADIIDRNVEQAHFLAELVDAHENLERVAPVPLNVVCFRYVDPDLDDAKLDRLNRDIVIAIQESGVAVPSQTLHDGHFVIRVAICNHRTVQEDLLLLAEEVVRHGRAMSQTAGARR